VFAEPTFNSYTYAAVNIVQLEDQIHEAYNKVVKSLHEFPSDGSGWVVDSVSRQQVKTIKYSPITESSYIPLPKHIQNSFCCV
jgi:hypothetical protein